MLQLINSVLSLAVNIASVFASQAVVNMIIKLKNKINEYFAASDTKQNTSEQNQQHQDTNTQLKAQDKKEEDFFKQ